MIYSGSVFGPSVFLGSPITKAYSNIKISGEAIFGYLKVSNVVKTTTTMSLINNSIKPEFDGNTIALAHFNYITEGGNISGITAIDFWKIYRRESQESTFSLISEESGDMNYFLDYDIQNGKSYKYQLFPGSTLLVAPPIYTSFKSIEFEDFYLTNKSSGVTYRLRLERELGSMSTSTDFSIIDTQSKFPTIINNGEKSYRSGTFKVIPGEISDDEISLEQSVSYINSLKDFINDKEEKIFKTIKGHTMIIKTYNFSEESFEFNSKSSDPMVVSWDWVEVNER